MIPKEVYEATLSSLWGPVQAAMADPTVSEVMVNGPDQIYVERAGRLERLPERFDSAEAILAALRNVAQFAGVFVDETQPILEAHLPDGSRLEAVIAPLVESGPVVSIRRFSRSTMTLPRLVELGSLDELAAEALRTMVIGKCNVLVSGGTGSGKTSMLNVLAGCIPEGERVLVLEDTREVEIAHDHVVYMQTRKADEDGRGVISIRDLFRASLRMRPDRILLGEIRGGEALDLSQAMVSGHSGCIATLHASTPGDALARLETMSMMSDVQLPLTALQTQLSSGVDAVVQVSRLVDGSRKVTGITEVVGFDRRTDQYALRELFARRYLGHDPDGRIRSELAHTGLRPEFEGQLRSHGVRWPVAAAAEG